MRNESNSEASQASCSASWLRSTIEIKTRYLYGFILPQTYLGDWAAIHTIVRSPQAVRYKGAAKWARVTRARKIVASSRLRLMIAMHTVRAVADNAGSNRARNHPSLEPCVRLLGV
jgi:hypothetical protein